MMLQVVYASVEFFRLSVLFVVAHQLIVFRIMPQRNVNGSSRFSVRSYWMLQMCVCAKCEQHAAATRGPRLCSSCVHQKTYKKIKEQRSIRFGWPRWEQEIRTADAHGAVGRDVHLPCWCFGTLPPTLCAFFFFFFAGHFLEIFVQSAETLSTTGVWRSLAFEWVLARNKKWTP